MRRHVHSLCLRPCARLPTPTAEHGCRYVSLVTVGGSDCLPGVILMPVAFPHQARLYVEQVQPAGAGVVLQARSQAEGGVPGLRRVVIAGAPMLTMQPDD